MKDKCVRCGRETEYVISIPIIAHLYFIEGSGQLCSECYRKLYMRENETWHFNFKESISAPDVDTNTNGGLRYMIKMKLL